MTRPEVVELLRAVADAWPGYYRGKSQQEAQRAVDLWLRALKNENAKHANNALERLICTSKYPPNPAELCAVCAAPSGRGGARASMDALAATGANFRRLNRGWASKNACETAKKSAD